MFQRVNIYTHERPDALQKTSPAPLGVLYDSQAPARAGLVILKHTIQYQMI